MIKKCLSYLLLSMVCYVSTSYATVKIGTLQFDPPFFVSNDGHAITTGFDSDLMKGICSELKWQCEFVAYKDYNKLIDAVSQEEVDYAISGIVIMPLNDPNLIFSMPYLISAGHFITLKSSQDSADLTPLQNKRIGVLAGRGYGEFLKQNPSLKVSVVNYYNYMDLFDALYNKKIDAIFLNNYTAMYLLHRYPEYVKLIDFTVSFANGIGILSRVENKDNIDKINTVLAKFEADGTFVRIYNYNFAFFIKQ